MLQGAAWSPRPRQSSAAAAEAARTNSRGSSIEQDSQPANILISESSSGGKPLVKLADFGVSVMARENDPSSPSSPSSPAVSQPAELADDEFAGTQSVSAPAAEADTDREPDGGQSAPPRSNPSGALAATTTQPDDLTEAGALVGTPMYMAPELSFGSRQAQSASDIFSFGVIAYELIAKEMPFKKPTIGSARQGETLPVPGGFRLCQQLGPKLIFLLESSLSADPTQRPTAAQLAEALAAC